MKNFTCFPKDLKNRYYVGKKQTLILIALFVSILGYSQAIGDTFVDNFITYKVTSLAPNTLRVNDYDHTNGGTDVDIPSAVSNSSTSYDVTSIGNLAFEHNGPEGTRLTSVVIPNSIVEIGNNAFSAQNLLTVTIPNSVVSIGNSAFVNNDLTSVTFENGLESIGDNAFQGNQIIDILIPNSVISIGQFAFQGNQLASAILSNNLTSVEFGTFQSNQLQSIVIPNSVTSIGNAVFNGNQITSVTLSNSLLTIGNGAFRDNNITHVTIPASVTDIDFAAFRDNPLATVTSQGTTPATIFMPGINDSFWNRAAIDLTIPNGTSAAYASGGWTGFNSVTEAAVLEVGDTFVVDFITYEVTSVLPDTVEAVDYNTAGGTVVDIPAIVSHSVTTYDVTSIGSGAFSSKNLTHVIIPNSIINMKNNAFNNNQFTSIIIPESVANIGPLAFGVNNLSTVVVLGTTPPNITTGGGADTFANSSRSNINLILTGNTTDEYVTDSGALWTGFKMVFEATSATTLKVSDYDAANGTNVTIPSNITIPSVTVFDVTEIGQSAFANRGITSVTIPDSVTNIGISAFELNSLTTVTIPDNVTVIGTTAFATNAITTLSLGNSVDIIGIGAFVDNNLTDITIPSNVTEIGLLAFGNNPSLASVTSLAIVPPTITTGTNDTFIFDRSNTALQIPAGTMGAYVTDAGALWTGFNPISEDALSVSDFEIANEIKTITTTGGFRILASSNNKLQNYTLYSISGAKVATGAESDISTAYLASGIYILKLNFRAGIVVKKIIVN
ncbi:leucine-rich repeat domain-containing protein [Winogradskyella forsetii]|uniref:leucine-rich repeat domain-containing protein n=1 Tax=Winogradskyella forsetii TaxID=2686077 RepID=UPI0015BDC93C|nr:leucine-rich repeat domain-containing protein [Winogradskyella forsetii]